MGLIRNALAGAVLIALAAAGIAQAQTSAILRRADNSAAVNPATSDNQAAVQAAAGSDASKALAVQGVTGGKALKVDGSAVTQPVSGSVSVSNFPATQPVSAAALPLPAGAATSANQTAPQAAAGADASKALAVQGVTGAKPVFTAPAFGPSGVSPVTVALTSATSTSTFTPVPGRDFNVSAWGTFVASFQLERSFDSGTTWLPITAAGTQLYQWTSPESETASEPEYGVQYRVRVTSYTSGTLNVRISQ